MVIASNGQHTTPRRGAGHVGMFENIRAAIDAGSFAIPNTKHPIKLIATRRCKTHLLRAPQSSRCQLFVHTGLKNNVMFF